MLKRSPAGNKEMNMQRRDFLKYSVALGAASALPLWSRAVFAADRPALPIPDLLTADARSRIQLVVQSGNTLFGAHNATTWGYNGNLLGPALQLRLYQPKPYSQFCQLTGWKLYLRSQINQWRWSLGREYNRTRHTRRTHFLGN